MKALSVGGVLRQYIEELIHTFVSFIFLTAYQTYQRTEISKSRIIMKRREEKRREEKKKNHQNVGTVRMEQERKRTKKIMSIMIIMIIIIIIMRNEERTTEKRPVFFVVEQQAQNRSACQRASRLIKVTCLKHRDIIRRLNVSLLRTLEEQLHKFASFFATVLFTSKKKIRKKLRYLATFDVSTFNFSLHCFSESRFKTERRFQEIRVVNKKRIPASSNISKICNQEEKKENHKRKRFREHRFSHQIYIKTNACYTNKKRFEFLPMWKRNENRDWKIHTINRLKGSFFLFARQNIKESTK